MNKTLEPIAQGFAEMRLLLDNFSTQENFALIYRAVEIMCSSIMSGGKILCCGNGGSLCDAMHFAEEMTGNFRNKRIALPAIAITDPGHLSCVANDWGYEEVFARYVEAFGKSGDVLLAISCSGVSSNVVRAAELALKKNMAVIALTGNSGGLLAELATLEIRVPHNGSADRIQEIHIKIIHTLIAGIENQLFES